MNARTFRRNASQKRGSEGRHFRHLSRQRSQHPNRLARLQVEERRIALAAADCTRQLLHQGLRADTSAARWSRWGVLGTGVSSGCSRLLTDDRHRQTGLGGVWEQSRDRHTGRVTPHTNDELESKVHNDDDAPTRAQHNCVIAWQSRSAKGTISANMIADVVHHSTKGTRRSRNH